MGILKMGIVTSKDWTSKDEHDDQVPKSKEKLNSFYADGLEMINNVSTFIWQVIEADGRKVAEGLKPVLNGKPYPNYVTEHISVGWKCLTELVE